MKDTVKTARFASFFSAIFLCALLLGGPPLFAQDQGEHPMEVFADGVEAFEDGQYQEAETLLKKAIEMDPDNLQFQYYLALDYQKLGRNGEALDIFTSLLEEEPENYRKAYFDIASIYSGQSQYEKALGILEQAIREKPDDARAHLEAATIQRQMGQYDGALKNLEKVAELDPSLRQTAYTIMGAIYYDRDNMSQAEEWFNKVIALDPNSQMAKDAESSLKAVAQQRRFLRPWRIRGQVSLSYDDNVPMEAADYDQYRAASVIPLPETVYEDKDDWYESLELYGDYRPLSTKTMRAGVRFSLNTTGYRELVQNNVLVYRPGAFFQWDHGRCHLGLRYDYSYYLTGGSKTQAQDYGWYLTFGSSTDKLSTHQIMPTLAIVEGYGLKTDLMFSWTDKDYRDQTPDSDSYLIGIVQSWAIGQSGRSIRGGYNWYKEDSSNQEFEYFYHEFLAGFSSPIYWGVIGDIQYSYTNTHFKKSPESGGIPLWVGDRRDKGHRLALTLTREVGEHMQFVLYYGHYKNDSNVSDAEEPWYDPYNYKRNLCTLTFTYNF